MEEKLNREISEEELISHQNEFGEDSFTSGIGAEAILEISQPGGQVLGIDADHEAIIISKKRLARFSDTCRCGNFQQPGLPVCYIDFG